VLRVSFTGAALLLAAVSASSGAPHAGNAVPGSSSCQIRFKSASAWQGRLAIAYCFLALFNFQS
jgi:hypothetical protein